VSPVLAGHSLDKSELRDLTEGGVSQSAPFVFSDSDIFQEKGNSGIL
jgi:hypothetical protein